MLEFYATTVSLVKLVFSIKSKRHSRLQISAQIIKYNSSSTCLENAKSRNIFINVGKLKQLSGGVLLKSCF